MQIREMKISDVSFVDAINKASLPENYPQEFYKYCISFFPKYSLVAEDNKEIVGYLLAKGQEENGHIISLAVTENKRGRKFGSFLLQKLVNQMTVDQIKVVTLFVRVSNKQAIKFYENFGFCINKRVESYYFDNEDAFEMIFNI